MLKHDAWILLVLGFALLFAVASNARGQDPRKVAILISTEKATHTTQVIPGDPAAGFPGGDTLYNSDYWNDLVLSYNTLRANGFNAENIHILYADGSRYRDGELLEDKNNPLSEVNIHRAKYENIRQILTCLSGSCDTTDANTDCPKPDVLLNDDFLFLVWIGHGNNTLEGNTNVCNSACGGAPPTEGYTFFNTFDQNAMVCDCELPLWMTNMTFRRRAYLFGTCKAGGVVDELSDQDSIVIASCPETGFDNSTYTGVDEQGFLIAHRKWLYLVDSALQQLAGPGASTPADTNSNNLISLSEGYDWGKSFLKPTEYQPILDDKGSFAPCSHLRLAEPSRDFEVFSKDHPYDWSNEPSSMPDMPWWDSPDLWVRNECSCLDERHQEPIVGKTNYICARFFNIGCAQATVSIEFKWAEPSTWEGWLYVNKINSTSVSVPSASTFVTAPVEWKAAALPGTYSLLAVADLPDDGYQSLDEVEENNVVRVALSNRSIDPGSQTSWAFVFDNLSTYPLAYVDVEFDLSQLPVDAKLILEIPDSIEAELPGECLSEPEDGWESVDLRCVDSMRPRIEDLHLEQGERRRAILTMRLGDDALEAPAKIQMMQFVSDKAVGGITFQATPASLEEVACRSLKNFVAVWRRFDSQIISSNAEAIVAGIDLIDLPCNPVELQGQYLGVLEKYRRYYLDSPSPYLKIETIYSRKLEAAANALIGYPYRGYDASRENRQLDTMEVSDTRNLLRDLSVRANEVSLYSWLTLQEKLHATTNGSRLSRKHQ